MPDMPPPKHGWSDYWWDTGRTVTRTGFLGLTFVYKEQWRFPFGNQRMAPDFRWVRARSVPSGANPMPNAVRRIVNDRCEFEARG